MKINKERVKELVAQSWPWSPTKEHLEARSYILHLIGRVPSEEEGEQVLEWFDEQMFKPLKANMGDSADDRHAWWACGVIRKALGVEEDK